MNLLKKIARGFVAVFAAIGLFVALDIAYSGQFEDSFTRTYILPNLANYATSSLPTAGLAGRTAFDQTLNVPTSDDGVGWRPLMTRYLARAASHIEINQASAPTVASCGSGSVTTGSSDTAGEITTTGTGCVLSFANTFASRPFAVVSAGANIVTTQAPRVRTFTTGIEFFNLLSGGTYNYVTIGQY